MAEETTAQPQAQPVSRNQPPKTRALTDIGLAAGTDLDASIFFANEVRVVKKPGQEPYEQVIACKDVRPYSMAEVARFPAYYARKHRAYHLLDATPAEVEALKATPLHKVAALMPRG